MCKHVMKILIVAMFAASIACGTGETTYTVKVVDGVQIVHNLAPQWGDKSKFSIEFVRNFGDWDMEDDDNYVLFRPSDIGVDAEGNVYITDSGNHRVQKYTSEGEYLRTIGRKGEGPGEFNMPQRIQIDSEGNIYVSTMLGLTVGIKILNPEGKEIDTIKPKVVTTGFYRLEDGTTVFSGLGISPGATTPEITGKLITVYDSEGKETAAFGDFKKYDDMMLNFTANVAAFTVDAEDNVYVAYMFQNKLEKYSLEGVRSFQSDRLIDYELGVKRRKMNFNVNGQDMEIEIPEATPVSKGVQIGPNNTVWVIGFSREERDDEKIDVNNIVINEGGDFSMNIEAKSEAFETDLYELLIYDTDGVLLGIIPLTSFIDNFRIFGNRLFLVDAVRSMIVAEYKINM